MEMKFCASLGSKAKISQAIPPPTEPPIGQINYQPLRPLNENSSDVSCYKISIIFDSS
jgi:hypothetical protein